MNDINELSSLELEAVAFILAERVKEYFKDPAHQEAFKEWYLKKYGVSYPPSE